MRPSFDSDITHRGLRFVIIGGVTTCIAYFVMMTLLSMGAHYSIAIIGAWPVSVLTGFALNRRITFGITTRQHRSRHLGWYVIGGALQLGLAIAGFGFLTQSLTLNATAAFLVNLVVTTAFSFGFMNLVAFRR
ncbi:MAG TPA: GtrA family protein [Micropepsaceae bacterium]|nr:GtrA family protein [Micropepsaceae bacterium]